MQYILLLTMLIALVNCNLAFNQIKQIINNKLLHKIIISTTTLITTDIQLCNALTNPDITYISQSSNTLSNQLNSELSNPLINQQLLLSNKPIASELFQKAEESIELTQKTYKSLDSNWNIAKNLFNELSNDITNSITNINTIEKDLINTEKNILNIFEFNKQSIKQLNEIINTLRISIASKYQLAEDSVKDSNNKPSTIAKLFANAQTEAIVLNEEETIFKLLNDIEETSNLALRKSADSVRIIQDTIKKLSQANIEYKNGLEQLVTSKALSAKKLEGVKGFRIGINTISQSLDKYNDIVRGLAKDIRSVQIISDDLNKLYTTIQPYKLKLNAFEKENFSNANIKSLKNLLNTLDDKIAATKKLTAQNLDELLESSNSISSKQYRKGLKISKKEELLQLLRFSSNQLETAEKSGKEAERLLQLARLQGEKEASIYLKYFQYAKPSTSSTSTTNGGKR